MLAVSSEQSAKWSDSQHKLIERMRINFVAAKNSLSFKQSNYSSTVSSQAEVPQRCTFGPQHKIDTPVHLYSSGTASFLPLSGSGVTSVTAQEAYYNQTDTKINSNLNNYRHVSSNEVENEKEVEQEQEEEYDESYNHHHHQHQRQDILHASPQVNEPSSTQTEEDHTIQRIHHHLRVQSDSEVDPEESQDGQKLNSATTTRTIFVSVEKKSSSEAPVTQPIIASLRFVNVMDQKQLFAVEAQKQKQQHKQRQRMRSPCLTSPSAATTTTTLNTSNHLSEVYNEQTTEKKASDQFKQFFMPLTETQLTQNSSNSSKQQQQQQLKKGLEKFPPRSEKVKTVEEDPNEDCSQVAEALYVHQPSPRFVYLDFKEYIQSPNSTAHNGQQLSSNFILERLLTSQQPKKQRQQNPRVSERTPDPLSRTRTMLCSQSDHRTITLREVNVMVKKQNEWNQSKQRKITDQRLKQEEDDLVQCTFKPDLTESAKKPSCTSYNNNNNRSASSRPQSVTTTTSSYLDQRRLQLQLALRNSASTSSTITKTLQQRALQNQFGDSTQSHRVTMTLDH